LSQAWAGLQPPLLRPHAEIPILAAAAILLPGVLTQGSLPALLRSVRTPRWWLPVIAAVAAIIGHVAIYWITRRLTGDTRYIVPANALFLVLLCLGTRPLISLAPNWARGCALSAALLCTLYFWPWQYSEYIYLSSALSII